MAAVTHRVTTASTANATSYASGAFTPASGDLLVALVVTSGTDNAGDMSDSQSLGFDLVAATLKNTSADQVLVFVARATAAASSMTVTYNCFEDAATGAIVSVYGVSGMTRVGSGAVRQYTVVPNAAAGTPAPAFAASCLTGNPTLGVIGNSTSPAGLTPPTGWTEPTGAITVGTNGDTGYATPTTGGEFVYRDSGFTGTTVTWGSASASVYGAIILELDASTAPTALITPVGDANNDASATARTSIIMVPPSGTQADDVVFVFLGKSTGTMANSTAPDGTWNLVDSQINGSTAWGELWYKRLTATASGTYTFTFGSTVVSGIIWARRGVDTTTLLDRTVQAGDLAADSTTPYDLPVISTATDGALVIAVYASEWTASGSLACVPAGYNTVQLANGITNTVRMGVHECTVPTAGSVGSGASYQVISTSKVAVVGQFALKPASTGTANFKTVTATVTATVTRTSKVRLPRSVTSSVTTTDAHLLRRVRTATATVTATVAKKLRRTSSVTSAITAAFTKRRVKQIALTATLSVASTVRRRVLWARSATVAATSTIRRLTRRARTATLTTTATVRKLTRQARTVTLTITAPLRKLVRRSRSATITPAASVRKLTRRARSVTATITAAFAKTFQSGAGALFTKAFSVAVTTTTGVRRKAGKALQVSSTVSAALRRLVRAQRAATVTPGSTVRRLTRRTRSVSVGIAASVARRLRRTLSSAVGVVMALTRRVPSAEPAPPSRTYRAPGFVRSTRMSSTRSLRVGGHNRVLEVPDTNNTTEG